MQDNEELKKMAVGDLKRFKRSGGVQQSSRWCCSSVNFNVQSREVVSQLYKPSCKSFFLFVITYQSVLSCYRQNREWFKELSRTNTNASVVFFLAEGDAPIQHTK